MSDQFTMKDDYDHITTTVAKYIRSDIENNCNNFPPLNWLPAIEELMKDERMTPTSVTLFPEDLLKHIKHTLLTKKNGIN